MKIKAIPQKKIGREVNRLFFLVSLFLTMLLPFPSPVLAEEGKSDQPGLKIEGNKAALSLKSLTILALKNNLDIAVESYNPQSRAEDIVQAWAPFDTTLKTQYKKDRSVTQTGTVLAGATDLKQENYTYDLSLTKKFLTGTETIFTYTMKESKSNATFASFYPQYNANWLLSLTQPLLKDFGLKVQKSQIRIASLNKGISDEQFKQTVIDILNSVQTNYWNLFFRIKDLEAKERSLERAKDFLKNTKLRIQAGALAPIEVYQAEAEVATREQQVIVAKFAVKTVEDNLKKALNIYEKDEYLNLEIVPAEEPKTDIEAPPFPDTYKIAIEKRPDYLQAKTDIEAKNIQVTYTKNQLFPRLDIIASVGTSGLSGQPQPLPEFMGGTGEAATSPYTGSAKDAFAHLDDGDFYTYTIGLKLEFPLENHNAKSQFSKAKIETAKALTNLKNIENTIINEVKQAIRDVDTSKELIRATQSSLKSAQEKLKAEQKKYDVGLSTIFDLLQYQSDLATAESNYALALSEYNKSLSNLAKVKGTLLEENDLTL
ncbi:MAG: TolC family protein [Proteobacteria bacterium]|nr:TolC family protein [Pseudomonadota bacterium]